MKPISIIGDLIKELPPLLLYGEDTISLSITYDKDFLSWIVTYKGSDNFCLRVINNNLAEALLEFIIIFKREHPQI